MRALWKATETTAPPVFGAMVRTMLLTGQRRTEVQLMRRSEITDAVWTIPAERYKTKRANVVPLSEPAPEVLGGVTKIEGCDFIFTMGRRSSRPKGREGAGAIRPFGNLGDAKADLDKTMAAALRAIAVGRGEAGANVKLPRWTLHDLRRTPKTLMTRSGIAPHVSERVLGHVIKGVEGVYDRHDYEAEKGRALEALAAEVKRIVAGESAKVIRFQRGAA